jgi:hypothetical protein
MKSCFVLLAVLAVAGCSDSRCASTSPCGATNAFAETLNGSWRATQGPPGQTLELTFANRGTSVVGTGSYGNDGRGGPLTVRGEVEWLEPTPTPAGLLTERPELIADLDYGGAGMGHLNQGRLFGTDTLKGVLSFVANGSIYNSYGITFVRIR